MCARRVCPLKGTFDGGGWLRRGGTPSRNDGAGVERLFESLLAEAFA